MERREPRKDTGNIERQTGNNQVLSLLDQTSIQDTHVHLSNAIHEKLEQK